MQASLIVVVTMDDIKRATFDMQPLKSPCPAGAPPLLFKQYWETPKQWALRFITWCWIFFNTSHMLEEMNATFISLVLKIASPHSVNHFQPIN